MKLRPHHLLCIQKYTGRGYDDAFAANMEALLSRLQDDPQTAVQLVEGRDHVCAACPHMTDGRCDSQAKVERLDRGVLAACGLCFGERHTWDALARTAGERILQTERFQEICHDCQWFDLCRDTRRGWINGKNA